MSGSDGRPQPFKLSLSKFLPQVVAPPSWPGLTPLEAELMGFLNGYRHWPLDMARPEVSLYEQAFARWQVMRHLPGAGPWHRVMALSKDLAMVHAYREVRTTFPLHEFWKRDKVKFTQRCKPHGGITAFVLSTLPAFRALNDTAEGQEVGRALLTALRYHENPALLPLNAGSLARELVDYMWRAEAQLRQLDVDKLDEMTPELIAKLRGTMESKWLSALVAITPDETPHEAMSALKQNNGTVWLRQNALLAQLGPLLDASMRQTLQLWETEGGVHHPAWPHLAPMLMDMGLIANAHEGVAAVNGCFTIRAAEATAGPVVKLVLDPSRQLPVLQQWQGIAGYRGPVDVVMDTAQLSTMAEARAREVDAKMAEMF